MTREQALAAVKKYGSANAAAKALDVPRTSFQHWLKEKKPHGSKFKPAEVPAKKEKHPLATTARKLTEFRSMYDKSFYIPKKIKAALVALGNGWDYEINFARLAGVSLTDLNAVREQFADYVVQIGRDGRRAWAGSKATAEQMRRMI